MRILNRLFLLVAFVFSTFTSSLAAAPPPDQKKTDQFDLYDLEQEKNVGRQYDEEGHLISSRKADYREQLKLNLDEPIK